MTPHFDRFDIAEAYYWYFIHYNGGMGSEEYERLCRLSQYFSPGMFATGPVTNNARAIYDKLVREREQQ